MHWGPSYKALVRDPAGFFKSDGGAVASERPGEDQFDGNIGYGMNDDAPYESFMAPPPHTAPPPTDLARSPAASPSGRATLMWTRKRRGPNI